MKLYKTNGGWWINLSLVRMFEIDLVNGYYKPIAYYGHVHPNHNDDTMDYLCLCTEDFETIEQARAKLDKIMQEILVILDNG